MKRKLTRLLLCISAALTLLCVSVSADSGPKPSVNVAVRGLNGEEWYATLLSSTDSTGPYSVFNKFGDTSPDELQELEADPAWRAFSRYADADGYYFLQFTAEGTGDGGFRWGYFPPQRFKVLLYFPESDRYVVSESAERYAFDSYFAVDLRQVNDGVVPILKSWEYGRELWGLLFRLALTIAVELAVALPFGYREKRYLRPILTVNLVTQLLLNLALNAAAYYGGLWMAMLLYLPLEAAVFLYEGAFYRSRFAGKGRPMLYAFAANALSFAVGAALAIRFPALF